MGMKLAQMPVITCDCCGAECRPAQTARLAYQHALGLLWDVPAADEEGVIDGYARCPACRRAGEWPAETFVPFTLGGPLVRLADDEGAVTLGLDGEPEALVVGGCHG